MSADLMAGLAEALADDAESLAALHDRELTPPTVAALKAVAFPANLGLLPPPAQAAQEAWRLMAAAVAALPAAPAASDIDALAAEYAAVYLTGAHGASPCESAWLDDDHLVCQAPMFALRQIYSAAGLTAADWRRRPDDHLVLQLLYLAHALRRARSDSDWRAIAAMLDEHLLRWLPDFATRIMVRAELPFYAALAALTAAWCDVLRGLIAEHLGEPRPTAEEVAARLRKAEAAPPARPVVFVPGSGPGW